MNRVIAAAVVVVAMAAASPVLAGSVSGRVMDAAGKPLTGVRVRWTAYRSDDEALLDGSRASQPPVLGETSTGPDGRFRIALDKPNLSVSLRVSAPDAPSIRLGGPFDSSDDVSLDDLHVTPSEVVRGRVSDDEGKPVPGARVRVVSADPFSDQDAEEFGEASTAADGSFTVSDAPSGARSIQVRAAGYVSASQVQLDPRSDVRVTVKHGGTVKGVVLDPAGKPAAGALVIAEDQAAETNADGTFRITGVDAGVRSLQAYGKEDLAVRRDNVRVRRGQESDAPLRLAKAAAIAGTVVDETTRKPVAGVRVGASSGSLAFGRRRIERSARTDAHGKFRLNGLAPRAYAVTASRDGFLATSINGIAAGLVSPGTVHIAVAKAASIAGKVVDDKGQPVAGAHVGFASDFNLRMLARRGPRAVLGGPGAITGLDGSFRIRNLAAARNLALEAGKAGYTTARHPGVTLKTGESVANLSLVLKKGLEARGRVVDAGGKPVPGAEIRVAARDGEGGFGGGRRQVRLMGLDASKPDASSAPDGTFVVRGLQEGEYTASVSHDGYARRTAQGLAVKASGENLWPPIALQNGVAIVGVVRDSQAQPIPGAQVLGIALGDAVRPQIITAGVDGTFRVDGLGAQKPILLNVTAAGFAPAQKNVTPPVDDLIVVLKTAGTVRGRVEDGDTKRPITDFTIARTGPRGGGGGGFAIQIGMGQGGEKAYQSEDGTYELPDVPAGKWTIRASAVGYRNGETSGVDVAEGETKEGVVISLRRGGSLSGRVLNTQGATVPNASVSWQTAGSGGGGAAAGALGRLGGGVASNTATTTDADGLFHFDGLAEGKITVVVDHPDYLEASRDVDPEKESSVDISLGAGATITGSVVAADGRTPIPGAQVSLNPEGDTSAIGGSQSTRSDGNGGFLFDHLKGGRFKITAQAPTGTAAAKEVILTDNQRQDGVIVAMAAGATLRGTVTGLPPGSLGGVRVSANGSNFGDSTQTDDSGAFTFNNVPAGVVRLQARTNVLSGRSASANVEVPDGGGDVPVQITFDGTSSLSGRVTKAGQPLGGLFVTALPQEGGSGRSTGQTDDNGSYSLQGLNDGTFQLALAGSGVSYRTTVAVSGATTQDVQIPTAGITGTVVEDGTGTPLESAVIQVETGQETSAVAMKSATTDSSGNYSIDGVDSGTYQVTARKSGYQLKTQTATVGSSEPAQANFSLTKGAGITIQVSDGQTGQPLHGVTAIAFGGNGGVAFQGSVSLDSTGRGEIASLSSGRYSIYIFSDGYAPHCLPAVDAPSPAVSVAMTPGGSVEFHTSASGAGRITDGSGMPYLMSPYRLDGAVNVVAPVGSWQHVSPGSYSLVVSGVSGPQSYTFTVAEGQTTRLDLK